MECIDIQPLPPQLIEATARVDRVSTRFNDLNTAVNATTFDGARVRTAVGNVATETQALQTNLQQAQERLTATQASLQALQNRAALIVSLALAGLGGLLLLLAGGQVTLFKESLEWFRKP